MWRKNKNVNKQMLPYDIMLAVMLALCRAVSILSIAVTLRAVLNT